ncbi:putative prefoldin subunit 5 [Venturia nashicola]|nr:putative prefoldin subunit 5 [Venturia nashicola]
MASPPPGAQQIKITDLSLPQLNQLKTSLNSDLQTLTQSFQSLRVAQSKFRDCLLSLRKGLGTPTTSSTSGNSSDTLSDSTSPQVKQILVPLTSSLYVPGTLANSEKVILDIGTGFFVEKSVKEAEVFYEGKVKELGGNIKEVEGLVAGKGDNLRMVEEVLRGRILEGEGAGAGAGAGDGGQGG